MLDGDEDRAVRELVGGIRWLAFSNLPPADAMARIRDLLREHDGGVCGDDE